MLHSTKKWVQELFQWADKNNIPDLHYFEDEFFDENGESFYKKIPLGLTRDTEKLVNLEELNLCWHSCLEMPEQLKNLTRLKKLNFAKFACGTQPPFSGNANGPNALEKIPHWITNLYNLEELDLSENKIRYVPKHIGKLTKLKKLYLHNNGIVFIEPNLGKLKCLEVLWLNGSYLLALPQTQDMIKKSGIFSVNDYSGNYFVELIGRILMLSNRDDLGQLLGINSEWYLESYRYTLLACSSAIPILYRVKNTFDEKELKKHWAQLTNIKGLVCQLPKLNQLWLEGLEGSQYGPIDLSDNEIEVISNERNIIIPINDLLIEPWTNEPLDKSFGDILTALDLWEDYTVMMTSI